MNEFAKPNLAVDQIPPSSSSDAGKALVVGENGVPGWAEVGGGGSGGGVEVVYLTLASSNDKGYNCTISLPVRVIPDTGATWIGTTIPEDVEPNNPLTIGVPKLGSGPVAVPIDALFTEDNFATIDEEVMPTASGGASFESDGIFLASDGTVAFAGKNVIT